MLLIDYSQLVIGAAQWWHSKEKSPMDMDLMRRLTLTGILDVKEKLRAYGEEVVLCMDSKQYWRRDIFPHYKGKRKANRAKQQESRSFDWKTFYECFDQMKREIAENLPIKCVEVEGAEADDVIATLARLYGPHKPVCIVSADNDFVQIQQNLCPSVKQWSSMARKFITPENQDYDLFEHVVRGDTGDGVPNILSDDDTFMNEEKRQTPIRAKTIEQWRSFGLAQPDKFCNSLETLERFERNKRLIDFRCIPEELASAIVNKYNEALPPKGKTFNYMIMHRLNKIMERGGF